jgi:hypothetical protein
MNKKIFASILIALVLTIGVVFGVAAANHWLPWQGCTPSGSGGLGCWINDCSTWILGPVSAVPDSSGVTVSFNFTVGDFATGPHNGHITVGYGGTFADPTYNQAATDTVDPEALFSGTVLDHKVVSGSSSYSKHFNLPVGTYTFVVYFGQDGCANCAQVSDPVTVTVSHKPPVFKPTGNVLWSVTKIERDPMLCYVWILDGSQPSDYVVSKYCGALWPAGSWNHPHNYIEGYFGGVYGFKDGWTGQFLTPDELPQTSIWW